MFPYYVNLLDTFKDHETIEDLETIEDFNESRPLKTLRSFRLLKTLKSLRPLNTMNLFRLFEPQSVVYTFRPQMSLIFNISYSVTDTPTPRDAIASKNITLLVFPFFHCFGKYPGPSPMTQNIEKVSIDTIPSNKMSSLIQIFRIPPRNEAMLNIFWTVSGKRRALQ